MTLVQCENLVKIYTQTGVDVAALQGLDLSVEAGEMIAIVGESGSGKSTLLNVLGGLDRPSAGQAVVAGQDLLHMSEAQLDHYRCTQVGFVWQQTTRNLTPYLSALENIELPMRLTGRSALQRSTRAHELLGRVGLAARAHHLPAQLSGGEQQRIAIAVALANEPSLLLADEPTGELDTATAISIYELLKSVNQSEHTTILIVSHDPTIQRHVGRVVAIRDGKTSTETVRVAQAAPERIESAQSPLESSQSPLESSQTPIASSQTPIAPIHAQFEELLMLDNAGRVQIPKEALEQSRIGSRVRLEVQGDRVILHGVEGYRREVQPAADEEEGVILIEEDPIPEPKQNVLRERVSAWLRRRTQ